MVLIGKSVIATWDSGVTVLKVWLSWKEYPSIYSAQDVDVMVGTLALIVEGYLGWPLE